MKPAEIRYVSFALGLAVSVGGVALAISACSDSSAPSITAPTFDSGTFDPFTNDSSLSFDATPLPDGATPDSGLPITISVSNSNVTVEGIVTLTALTTGETPESVTFSEGAAVLGTDTTAPFTQEIAFSFLENGTHSYVATAKLPGGGTLTSAPVSVTVNAAPNGYFVDPVNGLDTNPGTQTAPFLSIKKAVDTLKIPVDGGAPSGKSIYLANGTYTGANNGAGHILNQATLVRGLSKSGAIIKGVVGAGAVTAFEFTNGGAVRDVAFQDFSAGVLVDNGDFASTGLRFTNVTTPFSFAGASRAFLDETGMTGFWTSTTPSTIGGISVTGTAEVTLSGGSLDGANIAGEGAWVRGAGKLSIIGTSIKNLKDHVVTVWDDGKLALTNVVIQASGRTGGGTLADSAAIVMGNRNTKPPPFNESLTLTNTEISTSTQTGIGMTTDGASTFALTLTSSHLDTNTGSGLYIEPGSAPAGLSVTVSGTNSTFKGNGGTGAMIKVPALISFASCEFSDNSSNGLYIESFDDPVSLKVRNSKFSSNFENFITVFANTGTSVDLGKTGDLGGNTFTKVPMGSSAVYLFGTYTAYAVGNTWIPLVQGADANGKYTTPKTFTNSTYGDNLLLDGPTVILAE